ncbi:MAG: hypothetical protein KR126chlam1_00047 [Chlamydiae bacterium]|nr:hypothetical protein [Chlamydiota bacterium]
MNVSNCFQSITNFIPGRCREYLAEVPLTRRSVIGSVACAAITSVAYATSCGYASLGTVLIFLTGKYSSLPRYFSDDEIGNPMIRAVVFSTIVAASIATLVSALLAPDTSTGRSFDALVSGSITAALCAASLTAGLTANQKIPQGTIVESGKIAAHAFSYAATFYMRYQRKHMRCEFNILCGLLFSSAVFVATLKSEARTRS